MSAPDATLVFTTQERELIAKREGLHLAPSQDDAPLEPSPLLPADQLTATTQLGSSPGLDSALGGADGDAAGERRAHVFARLVPSNDAARLAFHELALACRSGKLLPHHQDALFINELPAEGRPPLPCDPEIAASISSDSEGPASVQGDDTTALLHGHFEFSFDEPDEPGEDAAAAADGPAPPRRARPHLGYRIGKGTSKVAEDRNVDILVVPPPAERSAAARQLAGGVASVHSLIQVHPASGALLLVASSGSRPVVYLDGDAPPLHKGASHVLFRRRNTFLLGGLQFCFEYLVPPERAAEFQARRDAYLRRLYPARPGPHPALLPLPREPTQTVDVALVHASLSSGAFGMVAAGVHKLTGAPLAIKELWIREQRHVAEVAKEADISNMFTEQHEGLLPTISASCEHGHRAPCGKLPERFHIITPLACGNFAQQDWSAVALLPRLRLYHDTLCGLRALHARGLMHRDVSPKNLLVVSLTPRPRAALCDYGKAVQKATSANTFIGPVFTLAPEVQPGRRYDRRVDVWSLAYAWYRALDPALPPQRVDKPMLATIQRGLRRFAAGGELELLLTQLMERMLAWDPEQRIGVDEALAHPCMRRAAAAYPPPAAAGTGVGGAGAGAGGGGPGGSSGEDGGEGSRKRSLGD